MSELQHLMIRVKKHDPRAMMEMRRQLEVQMVRIVRRVIRTGIGDSPLTRRILVEVRDLNREMATGPSDDPDQRIHRLAHRLCDSVLGGLQAGPRMDPQMTIRD